MSNLDRYTALLTALLGYAPSADALQMGINTVIADTGRDPTGMSDEDKAGAALEVLGAELTQRVRNHAQQLAQAEEPARIQAAGDAAIALFAPA